MEVKRVYYYGYSDISGRLWDLLERETFRPTFISSEGKLGRIIDKVSKTFEKKTPKEGVNINSYLNRAKEMILEWNYSYDEALGIVNIEYGYNPVNGDWD